MASSAGSFVDNTKIDEALKEVVDYHALKDRADMIKLWCYRIQKDLLRLLIDN